MIRVAVLFTVVLIAVSIAGSYAQADRHYASLKAQYDSVRQSGKLYIVQKGGRYGLAGQNGILLENPDNTSIEHVGKIYFLRGISNRVTDSNGKEVKLSVGAAGGAQEYAPGVILVKAGSYANFDRLLIDESGRELWTGYNKDDHPEFIPVTGSKGCGVMNYRRETVIPARYDRVYCGERYGAAQHGDTLLVFDKGGQLLSRSRFDNCIICCNGLVGVHKYGMWALMKPTGELVTAFCYTTISNETALETGKDDLVNVETSVSDKGLADSNGHEVIKPEYDLIMRLANGWFILSRFGHTGSELSDPGGKIVIEGGRYGITGLDDRYVALDSARLNGVPLEYYDTKLRKQVPFMMFYSGDEGLPPDAVLKRAKMRDGRPGSEFDVSKPAGFGYRLLQKTERSGEEETSRNRIGLPGQMEYGLVVSTWNEPREETLTGLADEDGYEVLPVAYGDVHVLKKHLFLVPGQAGWRLVTDGGKAVSDQVLKGYQYIATGIPHLVDGASLAFIDTATNAVRVYSDTPVVLTMNEEMPYSAILLKHGTKYSVVSKWGWKMYPFDFDRFEPDNEHHAVKMYGADGRWTAMDANGRLAENGRHSDADGKILNSALMVLCKNEKGKWGVLNCANEEVVPFDMDLVAEMPDGKYYFEEGAVRGYIDKLGNVQVREQFQGGEEHVERERFVATWMYRSRDGRDGGLYNSAGKRIAEYLPSFVYNCRGNYCSVPYGADGVAVIDSNGNRLLVRDTKPIGMVVTGEGVLLLSAAGDSIYTFRELRMIETGESKLCVIVEAVTIDKAKRQDIIANCYHISPGYVGLLYYKTSSGTPEMIDLASGIKTQIRGIYALEPLPTIPTSFKVRTSNNKWAIAAQGTTRLGKLYDSIKSAEGYSCLLVYDNGRVGICGLMGDVMIPCEYDSVLMPRCLGAGFVPVKKDGRYTLLSATGKRLTSMWDSMTVYGAVLHNIMVWRNGVAWSLNVTEADTAVVAATALEVPGKADIVDRYSDGLQVARLHGLTGLFNPYLSRWNIAPSYIDMNQNGDHIYAHRVHGRDTETVVFDEWGARLFSMRGWEATIISDGNWTLGGLGLLEVSGGRGRVIVPGELGVAQPIVGTQLYQVSDNGKVGIANSKGRLTVPYILEGVQGTGGERTYTHFVVGRKDTAVCLISPAGKQLTSFVYDEIREAVAPNTNEHAAYFVAVKQGKSGILDGNGREVIPCRYDSVQQIYKNRLATVKLNGKWGVIDLKTGKALTRFEYDHLQYYCFGAMEYTEGEKKGHLDEKGKKIREY